MITMCLSMSGSRVTYALMLNYLKLGLAVSQDFRIAGIASKFQPGALVQEECLTV